MKAILMSIKPKYVAKILNGKKTIEIRKRFPKGFHGWVYIYCTQNEHLFRTNKGYFSSKKPLTVGEGTEYTFAYTDEGKVVARFWCGKVEDITCVSNGVGTCAYLSTNIYNDIRKASCLNTQDLINYLGAKPNGQIVGKAINISNLEIFDKPKELSEFENYNMVREVELNAEYYKGFDTSKITVVKKSPQSWQYIEI